MKMQKIFLIVSMYIFALTHHLPKICASASDLSSSSTSSLPSLSLSSSASTTSSAATAKADITVPQSGAADAAEKSVSIAYEENKTPAKEISITASSSSSSSSSMPLSTFSPAGETAKKNLATRRQTRSLFYPYGGGLYSNLYIGYGTSASYYYPSTYSYTYYPTFYKYWGVYNPYYGYPRVISG